MGQRFRSLVGIIKDKASLTITALTSPPPPAHSPTVPPDLAVLRATSHTPSNLPPDPRHVAALLSFGSSSRLSALSLVSALTSRLSSTRDPCVALKALLSLHYILVDGSFILLDTVYATFLPSSGRRSPLNLSSFRSSASLPLSSWVRYYARLLELLLLVKRLDPARSQVDALSSSSNQGLLKELDVLIAAAEEISHMPPLVTLERNMLVLEVATLVGKERVDVLHGIAVRVREAKERLGDLGLADSVELLCLVRRMEECKGIRDVDNSLMNETKELKERAGDVVVEQRGRVRREKVGESARIVNRSPGGLEEPVRFGSSRWTSG